MKKENAASDYAEVRERVQHTVIVYRRRYVVALGLHLIGGVAHHHPYAGLAQYGNVVAAVAEGHGVGDAYAEIRRHGLKAAPLVGATGRDVHEVGIPPRGSATAQKRHHGILLLLVEERRELQNVIAQHLFLRRHPHVIVGAQQVLHDILHLLGIERRYLVPPHDDTPRVLLAAHVGDGLDIGRSYGVQTHRVVADEAVAAIGGHVAVDEMAYTTKVVDEQDRAARSYEYAYSACLGTLEGTDRRRRYLVGIEAHERAVNVEE